MHQREGTAVGSALKTGYDAEYFDAVVTSPCFGNRMADHHNAKDNSKRHTYRHYLGRELTKGSAAGMQWGEEYKHFHTEAWLEAKRVLKRQLAHQVDLIKVMATGGRLTKGSSPVNAQFSLEELAEIVNTAHFHHLPVAAHCHGTEGIYRAAMAGVDTIEHCSWVGEEGWASDYQSDVAHIIKEKKCRVSPTVNKGWSRMLDEQRKTTLSRLRKAYREMINLEIPLIASTDAGIPGVYHEDLADALTVFAQIAELSAEDAIKSATSSSARALGIAQTTGSLTKNKSADILILDGNPLKDLRILKSIYQVYISGQPV